MGSLRPLRAGWTPHIEPDEHNRISESFQPDLRVDEERGPVWSGLWGPDGQKLYRIPEPLGFHHPKGGH